MTRETTSLLAFNRGLMSRLGVARVDLKRTGLAAEIQKNWIPRVLGGMSLRPGTEFVGSTYDDSPSKLLPFVYASDDSAFIELTDELARVWIDDELVTRASVATTITNGTFTSSLTGWTDYDETGAASTWVTGGYMSLVGSGDTNAIREQLVSVDPGEQNTEHALRIVIDRGPVVLRVGSTSGGDDYIRERTLRTGTHSLTFTPSSGDAYVRFQNSREAASLISSVAIESAGVMTLPAPWAEADLDKIRYAQSADVVFLACEGYQQMRLERWATRSWSLVRYETEDGPFRLINTTQKTITPSALEGDVTLTASEGLFRPDHVGALFRITSTGQLAEESITGADQWTDPVLVTGVGGERRLAVIISGIWGGTVTLQYSVSEPGSWIDADSWTSNGQRTYRDDLDGQIIYYRLGIKSGEYTAGTANVSLSISSGSITGIARVTEYTSDTEVSASVLKAFGGLDPSKDWYEGEWSDRRGWPTAVALYEGRLCWFGKSKMWASVSDAFESFDDEVEGDSGPLSRSIGYGPIDTIHWALPMQRLILGTVSAEHSVRSSSFDEPLTPTNFSIKTSSTQGSKNIDAAVIDDAGFYVQAGGARIYSIGFAAEKNEYGSEDMTALVPDLGEVGFVRLAVQRQPDTRLHAVMGDGTVAIMVVEKTEDVLAWVTFETDGEVEDVCVLPGDVEDQVYYVVKRTINGATKRYIEKWAQERECRGGTLNKQADSFIEFSGPELVSLSGLDHLEGEQVVVWADGKDLGTYTVSSGSITLSEAVTSAVIGLYYEAPYQSMKQAVSQALSVPMNQRKIISNLGLVLADTHKAGIKFGPTFDTLDPLPNYEFGEETDADQVWEAFDQPFVEFPGEWTTDARICLLAAAPRPCTVLAVQAVVQQSER